MGLISFLIIPFIVLLVIVVGVVFTCLNAIFRFFGLGGRRYNFGQQSASGQDAYGRSNPASSQADDSVQNRKIIGNDEGEYVDFEEVN